MISPFIKSTEAVLAETNITYTFYCVKRNMMIKHYKELRI